MHSSSDGKMGVMLGWDNMITLWTVPGVEVIVDDAKGQNWAEQYEIKLWKVQADRGKTLFLTEIY